MRLLLLNRSAQPEDGAQVIEYARIIAVVSIALFITLSVLITGGSIAAFVGRVANCLSGTPCA